MRFQRLNGTTSTGTGAVTYTSQPKARASDTATWFDGIERPTSSASYGAIASFTRPKTALASGAATGFVHGLKMHFGPEAYRLMFNAGINLSTASDASVLPYVDHYFEYNPSTQAVTKEISAVCPSCPGGGTTADLFGYTPNPHYPGDGYSIWKMKTVQTLPDGSQIVAYTNFAAQPILKVQINADGTMMWGTFHRFTSSGQVMWEAEPSAVALPGSLSALEAYDDLLNYNSWTGLYQYLNNSTGLIKVTTYDGTGNVLSRSVQEGQSGSAILVASMTYTSNTDSSGNTITPVATSVAYPNASDPTITITTSFAYTYYTGTNQMSQKTTTLPVVSSGQNGSGSADTTVENFDAFGNTTSSVDERGIVNNYTNDVVMSRVTQQVLNYQSGVTQPGVNVTTNFVYDDQGRLVKTTEPQHTVVVGGSAISVQGVTWNVYNQSAMPGSGQWPVDSVWTGTGYYDGTNYTLINPVAINNMDKDGRNTDQISSVRTSGSGALSAGDTFAQTDWQSWSSTQYDNQHRTTSSRTYFLIPTSGTGVVGTNYGETDFGYDALERQNRVVAPGGTITRTVWTCPQWVLSTWVGTNDTGATDSDPTGGGAVGNNMVIVSLNEYDDGGIGDGNITEVTAYASATDTRVTGYGYDFRDRRISTTDATNRYSLATIDNLGRTTLNQMYATLGGNLISQSGTNWDDRSRAYQNLVYAVDPSTGTVGNVLTGNTWYDPSGNLIQNIPPGAGQVFTKSTYNGVNWVTSSYTGFNTSGTSYAQAQTVANDVIVSQVQNTYNEVGSIVSVAGFQRLNDTPSTGTGSTGALSYAAEPKARVSYSATWFDGIDRPISSANYGAIASFTRPSTPPSSSATVLVNGQAYDNAGRVYQTTDPKGIINQNGFDAAGRKIQTIEDVGGIARTTNFTFTLDSLIATMEAVNASTGNQTTRWTYGTTLADSGVARNDLLHSTTYPDGSQGWSGLTVEGWANLSLDEWADLTVDPADTTTQTYNRLGQKTTFQDQNGTAHGYLYDKLGRQTDDCITTVGTGVDSTVLRISTAYEIRGMANLITSYNNATPGSGTALNQVAMTYNNLGQLVDEDQDHGGTVSGSSPSVGYGYDTGASGSNEIRANGLTYPNARQLTYSFGTSGGMNDILNRIDTIQDTTSGTTNLAGYTYLGASAVIQINYPQPQVMLDLWGGTSGTFTGFDQFGRMVNQPWNNYNTSTMLDQYKYGYDQNSSRLWKQNVVGTPVVSNGLDELYTYDNLNRLTDMQRGTLNGTQTAITGTPTIEQDWTLDPTGNWSGYLTKSAGTTDLNQTRTSNPVNEITNITETTGPTWTVPAYDNAGNMTTLPQTAAPTSSFTATYDAWNRMMTVKASGTSIAGYNYDGLGRRIIRKGYTGGTLSETRHFYFTASGRDIEQRVGTATTMDQQNVWGVRYINELVCRDDATPQRLYVCQDANFNVTALIGASTGTVAQRFVFTPYGLFIVMNGSWSSTTDTFNWIYLFQGGRYDPATWLNLFGSRDYGLRTGGWVQRDDAYRDGANLYQAFTSNALIFLDPSGSVIQAPDTWPQKVGEPIEKESQIAQAEAQFVTVTKPGPLLHTADTITDRTFMQLFSALLPGGKLNADKFDELFTKPCQATFGPLAVALNPIFHITSYAYDDPAHGKPPRFEMFDTMFIAVDERGRVVTNAKRGHNTPTEILGQRAFLHASGYWTWDCVSACDPLGARGGPMKGKTIEVHSVHAFASKRDIDRARKKIASNIARFHYRILSYGDLLESTGSVGGIGYVDETAGG